MSIREIVATAGRSYGVVWRCLKRMGLPMRRVGRPRRVVVDDPAMQGRAAAAYLAGLTIREVGARLGVSSGTAHALLVEAGVPRRRRGA